MKRCSRCYRPIPEHRQYSLCTRCATDYHRELRQITALEPDPIRLARADARSQAMFRARILEAKGVTVGARRDFDA